MKLTPAQFSTLHLLAEYGSKAAVEVTLARAMDGSRKTKLEWNVASSATLAVLEANKLVDVERAPLPRPVNAVGKPGLCRTSLRIQITEAGRAALSEQ